MINLLILASVLAGVFYYFCIRPHQYWKKRGVKQGKPIWLFGNIKQLLFRQQSMFDWATMLYNMFPQSRYFGAYGFATPQLIVRDPELIKNITVRDFEYFVDRQAFASSKADPLWGKNLVLLQGQEWKDMRNLMSPAYTNSKMKSLFNLMVECSENFVDYFVRSNEQLNRVKIVDIVTRFTNDVIATTAYGIKIDSLAHPNNEFVTNGKQTAEVDLIQVAKFFAYPLMPKIFDKLKIRFIKPKTADFFTNVIFDTVKARTEKGIVRPDMLNVLIEARKNFEEQNSNRHITDMDIAAQAYVFFLGGFDTVSTLFSMMFYELAVNPEVQDKLRKEIQETKTQSQGKLTYEALMGMRYLDMVVSETLRKWPSMPLIQRKCTKPYTIEPVSPEESLLTIEKGTMIIMPSAIQNDPKYWPNPEKFNPERFSNENKSKIHPYTYFPFGVGPRMCIGNRFTLMEVKTLTFYLTSTFEVVPIAETKLELSINAVGPKPVASTILGFRKIL